VDIELSVTNILTGASQHFTTSIMDRLPLGRDSGSPIQFRGDRISRTHLDLISRDGRIFVQDLSTNGTWVNGERAAKGYQLEIHDGGLIEIPGYRIEVSLPDEKLSTASSRTESSLTDKSHPHQRSSRLAHILTTSVDPLEGVVILGAICSFSVILLYVIY